ncbi:MAG: GNAT family N-acetyltransferase [Chloroflexota bacterium]
MATSAVSSVATRGITARSTTDRGLLRAFLERDRLFAAYALCDLDVREFARTRWGVAIVDDEPIAVVLEYGGSAPQPVFAMGENAGISAVLRDVIQTRAAYAAVLSASLPALEPWYRVEPGPQMVRMWVDRASFRPFPADVSRLLPVEIGDLNRLYQLGFTAWLPPSAIDEGVYYGIRVGGRLVAAAGTHVVSPEARLGVVGNVMTQDDYRGRGYATSVTGAVTAELLRFCDQVALNVRADNAPALQAYRKLGYREHVRYEERLVHRTAGGGGLVRSLTAPFRRFLGRPAGPRA